MAPRRLRLLWLSQAVRSRDDQLAYVAERNPRAALALGDALEAAVARLQDFPESGREGRISGTRELVVSGTAFVIVYRLDDAIRILRVLHGAQRWPPL